MQTTELGFTHAELFETALTMDLVEVGEEIELEDLQELLSDYAGNVL